MNLRVYKTELRKQVLPKLHKEATEVWLLADMDLETFTDDDDAEFELLENRWWLPEESRTPLKKTHKNRENGKFYN